MWKSVLEWIGYLFRHKETTEKNTAELKELRDSFDDMIEVMRQQGSEIVRTRENEAHEREKLALRLELLLSRQNRLPPGGSLESDREELLRLVDELRREIAELRAAQEPRKLE